MPISMGKNKECCGGGCCESGCCNKSFGKKLIKVLAGILIVYLIFYVGTLVQNNIKKYNYIGMADKMERTITVSGYGKVTGSNDIAVTSIGYENTDKDVAKAQQANKKVMDQVVAELSKLGIADKDMESSYSIYPEYNYTSDKGQTLLGYRVSNSVSVKIRDLKNIPAVLNLAGKYGANNVGGLNFTIDDPENLKSDSRVKALADAKTKAIFLANSLGVRLGSVVSYNEYESAGYFDNMKLSSPMMAEGGGMGGGAPEAIASGSKDVVMNVNVTYEILSR